ncbi:16S rRNA (cytosine(967)-C(5))-methyltransferase RsmB [Corticibacter populi]|uniref:16S rRNA (Cytosine(967)-C(5))-methyltransferase RsmB n=1 Tax=Corticibacter populi TaxID=1550736 RepID=A0A3M6QFR6_9BURK|nr:16S rRNA (cytosine(967)-C(5))-methyltransferase RsmB [Corticibacter populi]RMX01944.1 16S rRNA (cytosine(967)-C(5))-methyltransferase RsmB [Corticibacter populi]RZS29448.1 16S rRNA (cytosine967-C5)-methyltransferase [Corticibacter populi]
MTTHQAHPSQRPRPSSGAPDSKASPALWQQLDLAARGLQAVRAGQSARALVQSWPEALRPGAQALLYHTLRHTGTAASLQQQLVARRPQPQVEALLCVALSLLLDDGEPSYAPFTVVDQAVEALRRRRKFSAQAGFVNACLRRFLRERDALLAAAENEPQARWNHPLWWIERLRQDYPDQWRAILAANNQRAPLTLRVNQSRCSRADYLQLLAQRGVAAQPIGAAGVVLGEAMDVRRLPGYADGWFSVQDAGAQLAAPMLLQDAVGAPTDAPLLVLDACAAPGGKTAHLLELAAIRGLPIELLAMDVDATRCERITQNLTRLQLPPSRVVAADASRPQQWCDHLLQGRQLDLLLLDAPCSAAGIVRRHPDIRWLRRASDIEALAAVQQSLLSVLWPLLKPGGRLLYCTCSVFHTEGEDQVRRFLARQDDAQLLAPALQLLPTLAVHHDTVLPAPTPASAAQMPQMHNHDGFFYALLGKRTVA